MSYINSCLNYTGGKYKLLPQIMPLFPKNIDTFVDLFCGGASVGINSNTHKIICNDIDSNVIELFQFLQQQSIQNVFERINNIIDFYSLSRSSERGYSFYGCNSRDGLSKVNKEGFDSLKDDFNNIKYNDFNKELLFYVLIIFSFNNQIRYNRAHQFNLPTGKRDFNKSLQAKLQNFIETIQDKNILFCNKSYDKLSMPNENVFLYIDPPYLITTATYNEQNRWTENEEKQLLNYIDELNKQSVKFALSNVFEMNNTMNHLLKEWSKKYTVHYLNFNYNNSNYQKKNTGKTQEILICNY
ncbi:MAG: DNA adenine methylase [Brevinema sp.]